MSLFENFPYTNMHELNLDWIIGVIKEFKEKYPDIITELEKKLNKPLIDPIGREGSFLMSNGDGSTKWEDISVSYRQEIINAVDEWLEEHPEVTTTVEDGSITTRKFNNQVYTLPFNYPCNIVAEFPIEGVQGATWVTENKYVFAVPIGNNTCTLYEWDQSTNKILRSANVECYHGNSIAYDPESGFLYISDCIDDDNNGLRTITVVNYVNFAFIRRITAPVEPAEACLSIAYDAGTHRFYSTNYRGTSEGRANALYEYNGVFESVNRIIVLDDYSVRYNVHHSNQGVHCVRDGIAYIPYYEPSRLIVGFNIETGEKIIVANVPEYLNNYKYTSEIESITYNANTDSYIVFTRNSAFEIGLFKSILVDHLYFTNIVFDTAWPTARVNATPDQTSTKPVTKSPSTIPVFRSVHDAINAGKLCRRAMQIIITSETPVEYTEEIRINDYNCRLSGALDGSNNHLIKLTKRVEVNRSVCSISDMDFSENFVPVGNNDCIDIQNSMVYVFAINFLGTSQGKDVIAFFGSFLQTRANTYSKGIQVSNGSLINWLEDTRPNITFIAGREVPKAYWTKIVDTTAVSAQTTLHFDPDQYHEFCVVVDARKSSNNTAFHYSNSVIIPATTRLVFYALPLIVGNFLKFCIADNGLFVSEFGTLPATANAFLVTVYAR